MIFIIAEKRIFQRIRKDKNSLPRILRKSITWTMYLVSMIIKCHFFFLAEDRADALIQDLITSTKVSKSPQEILKEMEAERKEMEEQFTIRAGEAEKLREQEVLSKY